MALTATMHRLKVQLSDADRGVYEALDLRLAQHPSETTSYLVTRALAYCLCYEEGIQWSHGLSHVDEPAAWVKTPDGRILVWIEVGTPSGERLHRASKASPKLIVFTHHDPSNLLREVRKTHVHRVEDIEVYAPTPALIAGLAERVERNMAWELVRSGGQLYVTLSGQTFEGELARVSLAP